VPLSQGVEIGDVLFVSGQLSDDAKGQLVGRGSMRAQAERALDNLETVLQQAGFGLGDVVRLNYYVTDVGAFFAAMDVFRDRFQATGCRPASTLLGVAGLARPELMIEIEATAVA
jgi:enamine deaminase RidA (YjgF/YER057c/UK114 family)